MNSTSLPASIESRLLHRAEPILALDVATPGEALALVERVPGADFVKVGLQLYTAAGPQVVRELRGRGKRVFLDLKLHDIPNTVAGAVRSAAALEVDLLTVHASGGEAMLAAAANAAAPAGPKLLAVTVLTSFSGDQLARSWGRGALRVEDEVVRLARLAQESGIQGVVASAQELSRIRAEIGDGLEVLTPGIRLPGDAAGDQARVAGPGEARRLGADYIVLGRAVTAAADPQAAWDRVVEELRAAGGKATGR